MDAQTAQAIVDVLTFATVMLTGALIGALVQSFAEGRRILQRAERARHLAELRDVNRRARREGLTPIECMELSLKELEDLANQGLK